MCVPHVPIREIYLPQGNSYDKYRRVWATLSHRVKILVNVLRNGLDLSVQVILDVEHVGLVVFRNEIDRDTQVTKPT